MESRRPPNLWFHRRNVDSPSPRRSLPPERAYRPAEGLNVPNGNYLPFLYREPIDDIRLAHDRSRRPYWRWNVEWRRGVDEEDETHSGSSAFNRRPRPRPITRLRENAAPLYVADRGPLVESQMRVVIRRGQRAVLERGRSFINMHRAFLEYIHTLALPVDRFRIPRNQLPRDRYTIPLTITNASVIQNELAALRESRRRDRQPQITYTSTHRAFPCLFEPLPNHPNYQVEQ